MNFVCSKNTSAWTLKNQWRTLVFLLLHIFFFMWKKQQGFGRNTFRPEVFHIKCKVERIVMCLTFYIWPTWTIWNRTNLYKLYLILETVAVVWPLAWSSQYCKIIVSVLFIVGTIMKCMYECRAVNKMLVLCFPSVKQMDTQMIQ